MPISKENLMRIKELPKRLRKIQNYVEEMKAFAAVEATPEITSTAKYLGSTLDELLALARKCFEDAENTDDFLKHGEHTEIHYYLKEIQYCSVVLKKMLIEQQRSR